MKLTLKQKIRIVGEAMLRSDPEMFHHIVDDYILDNTPPEEDA